MGNLAYNLILIGNNPSCPRVRPFKQQSIPLILGDSEDPACPESAGTAAPMRIQRVKQIEEHGLSIKNTIEHNSQV